ncbi:hypothetical protein QJS10_CPB20g00878 [Acorus calamus]|uniref:RecA family profile 1 domain-containing protein n=1 Tax=Acorus calamus TaxID=4465 RepID=A0AAV9CBC9_ACOCL|nr:hypothetical protein QJS10_CPB20g00878 [Acorus calamus]
MDAASVLLKQGIAQMMSIIDGLHQPWLNGIELLDDAKLNKHFLATGCEGIDQILRGGLRMGQLTELVGPSSSGKTQVCLCAASHVAEYSGTTMFFDTGNSFSPERIERIINHRSKSQFQADQRRLVRVMSSISSRSVFDIFELFDMLGHLENTLKSQVKDEGSNLRLIVIDSISSLLAPILGDIDANGWSLMQSAGFLLKRLADEHNLSVVVRFFKRPPTIRF